MCKRLIAAAAVFVCGVLIAPPAPAYEPDRAERKRLFAELKPELIAATPAGQRFAMRFALAGSIPFKDYERLARRFNYEPYDDCTVATFVQVTSYQIATGTELEPEIIAGLHASCTASEASVLGPKPLSQAVGDHEIVRGMWQRYLEQSGQQQNDSQLVAAAKGDATERFRELYGDPANFEPRPSGFVRLKVDTADEPPLVADRNEDLTPAPPPATPTSSGSTAAPSGGRSNNVDRLILRTVTRYGLGGVYVANATYLLLKDGSIFSKPYDNPYTLNVAESQRLQTKSWGRWREQGSALQVTWPNKKTARWEKWFHCREVDADFRLEGRFQSADSFGGGAVANFNTVAFSRDGRFSLTNLKGGATDWLPVYSETATAGRYTVDGYALRLETNAGSVEEFAFCLYPKDDEHFAIGASHFVPLN